MPAIRVDQLSSISFVWCLMAKLHIPPEGITTLRNTAFFSFKRDFTQQIIAHFGAIIHTLKEADYVRAFPFPAGTDTSVGKISKGEQYQGLPYVIADFPRLFSNDTVLAYRIMFWWGHYFSFTWHLQGEVLNQYWPAIRSTWPLDILPADTAIAWQGDPWQHAVSAPYYQSVRQVSLPVERPAFVKLALVLPFEKADQLKAVACDYAMKVLTVLRD